MADTPGERSAPSRREMDERLQEIQDREVDLDVVLQRIVETAVEWTGARYGALGVIGEEGSLSRFIPVGMDGAQIAAIGHWPQGRGVLGELIRHPVPLRLAEVSEHPAACGFPEHHPVLHSFLGAPVRVGGAVYGNLYLAEKRGGGGFDARDESLLWALAVAAGSAIDGQRWYRENHELEAVMEVSRALLAGENQDEVLRLTALRAKDVTDADVGLVAVPAEDGETLSVPVAVGLMADQVQGLEVPMEGTLAGTALRATGAVFSADLRGDPRVRFGPARSRLGPAASAPMRGPLGDRVYGVLFVARLPGRAEFSPLDVKLLEELAARAGLGFQLAERRAQAEEMRLIKDRARIARDLQDLAIQRMLGTAMSLQSVLRRVTDPTARQWVAQAVEELDDTSEIIRNTIFELEGRHIGETTHGVRARLVEVVDNAVPALGFAPALRMEGLLDTTVTPQLEENLLAVLVEALGNIARHAHAHHTEISVIVTEDEAALTVDDDGVGIPRDLIRRSGLANLADRARDCGGRFSTENRETGGTRLCWSAPLHPPGST